MKNLNLSDLGNLVSLRNHLYVMASSNSKSAKHCNKLLSSVDELVISETEDFLTRSSNDLKDPTPFTHEYSYKTEPEVSLNKTAVFPSSQIKLSPFKVFYQDIEPQLKSILDHNDKSISSLNKNLDCLRIIQNELELFNGKLSEEDFPVLERTKNYVIKNIKELEQKRVNFMKEVSPSPEKKAAQAAGRQILLNNPEYQAKVASEKAKRTKKKESIEIKPKEIVHTVGDGQIYNLDQVLSQIPDEEDDLEENQPAE